MPRPKKCRLIQCRPDVAFFKPQGVPMHLIESVFLGVDELEALRLADLQCLSQEEAALHMNVSRATFGRIVAQGRQKIAEALVHGKAIQIEGGKVEIRHPSSSVKHYRGRYRHGR